MAATLILKPVRIEQTGTPLYEYNLPPIAGYGQIKDVLVMLKVHQVDILGTTQVGVVFEHSPDGDQAVTASYATVITPTTITTTPILLEGETDSDTNGELGEYIHPAVTVRGTSGGDHWAMVEMYFVNKPI